MNRSVLVVALLGLTLAACGEKPAETPAAPAPAAAAPEAPAAEAASAPAAPAAMDSANK